MEFLPHRICLNFNSLLILLTVAGDLVIALSYFVISAVLFTIAVKLRFRFRGFILAFALFILLCGATHGMKVYVLWVPQYWAEGWLGICTAFVSLFTALTLAAARDAICKFIEGRKADVNLS